MSTTNHASNRCHAAVEHAFGYLLNEIRAERAALGLPAQFEFVCLVHGYSAPWALGIQVVEEFRAGAPLVLLNGSPLVLARNRDELYNALIPLCEAGDYDASYNDYSRPDATLLHIHHVHRRLATLAPEQLRNAN